AQSFCPRDPCDPCHPWLETHSLRQRATVKSMESLALDAESMRIPVESLARADGARGRGGCLRAVSTTASAETFGCGRMPHLRSRSGMLPLHWASAAIGTCLDDDLPSRIGVHASAFGRRTGTTSRNVLPAPGELVTVISPPRIVASRFEMA